jgi:hypothetical protein
MLKNLMPLTGAGGGEVPPALYHGPGRLSQREGGRTGSQSLEVGHHQGEQYSHRCSLSVGQWITVVGHTVSSPGHLGGSHGLDTAAFSLLANLLVRKVCLVQLLLVLFA